MIPKKPNIEKFKEDRSNKLDAWYQKTVHPRLVYLLNKAQSRIKNPIRFVEGMGTRFFDLGHGDSSKFHDFNNIFNECESRYRSTLILRRFPELVEFLEIIDELNDDDLEFTTGDIHPTVPPKSN